MRNILKNITKLVKKDIEAFNNEDRVPVQNLPSTITFESLKDPDGELWLTLQPAYASEASESEIPFVPLSVKRKVIDLCHLLDRSREEQVMLKDEMDNTWNHFSRGGKGEDEERIIIYQSVVQSENEISSDSEYDSDEDFRVTDEI